MANIQESYKVQEKPIQEEQYYHWLDRKLRGQVRLIVSQIVTKIQESNEEQVVLVQEEWHYQLPH